VKTADDAIDNDGDGIGDDLHVNGWLYMKWPLSQ
jgi:hypothetical protein